MSLTGSKSHEFSSQNSSEEYHLQWYSTDLPDRCSNQKPKTVRKPGKRLSCFKDQKRNWGRVAEVTMRLRRIDWLDIIG
jgi:hypothetical protein